MSQSWSIDLPETRRIFGAVAAESAEFDTAATALTSELAEASAAAPGSRTAMALLELAESQLMVSVASAKSHLESATFHTAEAVDAYERGDLQMAEDNQGKLDEVAR
ncbi:hypothetical protein E3O25_09520 [Cryobacterium sp. TMT1-3]|uniref:Excreted virulence factor EspC, type VII ESX diderm n=1 Tax=Cryobacterium luteum TaxID=1424661 RepID=A0A1H8CFJ1_9MICO|nr:MULTISPECIES: DUF6507 family protein [Cryobacterium]TFB89360.1 hypothetical protein E3O10_10910 [Cryobacterium luteum]TFC27346.1 hypothetical protein E3O25_09520 [Cryobacterium sp. TMT1-3]SEM93795.1 hypothetical protein SAMN05216281_102377 [Cryobacterium luteum]